MPDQSPSQRASRIGRRLHAVDAGWFARVVGGSTPPLESTLPRLSRAADHSLLWLALAGVLGLSGRRRGRRAALRGVAALSVASAATNLAAKRAVRRSRPVRDQLAPARIQIRVPASSSFPSGHAASAAAFATGVAMEAPAAGAAVGALAVAVAGSRVYTGVHYPSDVAAGVANRGRRRAAVVPLVAGRARPSGPLPCGRRRRAGDPHRDRVDRRGQPAFRR